MHDGEIIKMIRLTRGFNQAGAGNEMGISQQGFAKWEKKKSIPDEQLALILKVLNSSQKEFDTFRNLRSSRQTMIE